MATIRDVAKLAGVSVATVSRVINEKGYVHEDTVKQVKQAIEELQYKPNAVAKALFKKSSTMIAVLVSNLEDPSYITLLRSVEEAAYKEGYQIVICNIENKSGYIEILMQNNIAGVIMTNDIYKRLDNLSIPFVVLDEAGALSMYYDSAKKAVVLLKEKGCHFLAYIGEEAEDETMEEHVSGFLDGVWEEGLAYREEKIEGPEEKQIIELLRKYPYIDGVVTSSDAVAIAVVHAASYLGIHIPEHLQVVGFKGSLQGEWVTPSLTTIGSPFEKQGVVAVQKLVGKIKKKQVNFEEVQQEEFLLIERESTK
ncbi:LacI family DNA-binding transcriptional regulator [Bacillus sp. Xin]|uniref:LacI family DNA-binding transcriptional regulator n=1 Tax=unclassified Bacillus (in: firmicutes) TaxID=185979 RepID=UPI00157247E7|nr:MULTISPECIES: LacI family DNA-binding transcriptional regulator [unclassified Bacillus (in: firmicutes)]MBC6974318.1 LacI family DNA-binding transcriptional regulator [Bacillus sp. Xin]NSW34896.1 LacI family DNA-binding transcriptional regulator [Bacillus sp. Xin1]